MIDVDINWSGMNRIDTNLDRLSIALRDKAMKKAMKATITPIHGEARMHCATDTGTLRDAIQMKISSKGSKGETVFGIVGIRRGIKVPVRVVMKGRHKGAVYVLIPTKYAHLIERGHRLVTHAIWERDPKSKHGRLRLIKGSGAGTVIGFVKARPFMRPAWDRYGGLKAVETFVINLDKALQEEINNFVTGP